MQELDLHDMWFEQDCTIGHTERVTIDLLRCEFGEHFISHSIDQLAAYIVRFNALRLFLWGYAKAHVSTDVYTWIDALEDNIEAFVREIPAEMLGRVYQNWTKRMDHLMRSRGQHLHEIIFKH